MRHVFTTREKVLLVILAVLVIAVGYWKLILTPINDSIAGLNLGTGCHPDQQRQVVPYAPDAAGAGDAAGRSRRQAAAGL